MQSYDLIPFHIHRRSISRRENDKIGTVHYPNIIIRESMFLTNYLTNFIASKDNKYNIWIIRLMNERFNLINRMIHYVSLRRR